MTIAKIVSTTIPFLFTVVACSDTGGDDMNGTGGSSGTGGFGGGGGGGQQANCNTSDFSRLASAAPVSLRTDLMPMFRQSCTLSTQCHGTAPRAKAQLNLGPTCDRPMGATDCTNPLTDADATAVHAEIVNVPSLTAPAVSLVVPGNPSASFLIQKVAGTHDDQGHACTPADQGVTGCGDPMPPLGDPLCEISPDRYDLLAAWILQNAPNN